MYKQCATEESAQRQRQLEQCLLELMLLTDLHQITISDICDRAGISRKSFYRYFGSKEDCLYALIDHAIMDGASFYLPNHTDRTGAWISAERFFRYWKEQATLMDALKKNGLAIQLMERMILYISQEEHDLGILFPPHHNDTREQILFYCTGIMTLVVDWHASGYQKSVLQMSKILTNLIG